jgi:hypothetical protein
VLLVSVAGCEPIRYLPIFSTLHCLAGIGSIADRTPRRVEALAASFAASRERARADR